MNNSFPLIGQGGGIIPPVADIDTAREREKECECYDWWFCHKKL